MPSGQPHNRNRPSAPEATLGWKSSVRTSNSSVSGRLAALMAARTLAYGMLRRDTAGFPLHAALLCQPVSVATSKHGIAGCCALAGAVTYASCSDVSLAPGFRVVGAPLESVITAAQLGLTALSLTPGNDFGLPPPEPSVRPALKLPVSGSQKLRQRCGPSSYQAVPPFQIVPPSVPPPAWARPPI